MEPNPAGGKPTMPEVNEDLVRAVMVASGQELKDILYEGCEQAVQKLVHRTLTIYLQSEGRMPLTADSSNTHTPSAIAPPTQVQPAAGPKQNRFGGARLKLGAVDERPQVVGVSSPDEPRPVPLQPRKVSLFPAALPVNTHSPDFEPYLKDGDASKRLGRSIAGRSIAGRESMATVALLGKGKQRITKAHTKKSMLNAIPRSKTKSIFQDHVGDDQKSTFFKPRMTMSMPAQGIFANAEDMKDKLRAALTETPYDVTSFYSEEGLCQAIARSTIMESITLGVIAFNALWISIDVDLNDASIITEASPIFQVVDNFFCLFFLFEISVRWGAFEVKKNCLRDAWFVFDAFMSISMVLDTWIFPLVVAIATPGGGYQQDTSLLKGLRLARLLRMARVLRLLRALPELMVVIKGLFVAARAVSCTLVLMLMIIYVFAITFRQLTDGTEIGKTLFKSVPATMRYLMVQGTMPDLYDPVHDIWDENVFFALTFLIFIFVTSITVMNMLVGIMVGVIDTVASVEKEQLTVSFVKDHLMTLLEEMQAEDTDKDGLVSKEEFEKLIQTPHAVKSFTAMGVDVINLVDLCDFIFCEEGVGIPFGDFMELILQLRGSNQATVKDVVDLRRFMAMEMRSLFETIEARLGPEMKGDNNMAIAPAGSLRPNAAAMGLRTHKAESFDQKNDQKMVKMKSQNTMGLVRVKSDGAMLCAKKSDGAKKEPAMENPPDSAPIPAMLTRSLTHEYSIQEMDEMQCSTKSEVIVRSEDQDDVSDESCKKRKMKRSLSAKSPKNVATTILD